MKVFLIRSLGVLVVCGLAALPAAATYAGTLDPSPLKALGVWGATTGLLASVIGAITLAVYCITYEEDK